MTLLSQLKNANSQWTSMADATKVRRLKDNFTSAGFMPTAKREKEGGVTSCDSTLTEAAARMRTRIDLKKFLHLHCGLSNAAAAAKVRELWEDKSVDSPGESKTPRADIARSIRDNRAKEESRLNFLIGMVDEQEAYRKAAAKPLPVHPRASEGFGYSVSSADYWLPVAEKELASELDAQLAECKSADAIQAVLVRVGWPEEEIGEYLDRFGPDN